jgi:CRP/FNR family transcriptional regulator
MEFVSNELACAHERLLLLGRKDAKERVASFLLMIMHRQHRDSPGGGPIHLSMPQVDIADYLGLRHETVSRALAALRRSGAIRFDDSDQIFIVNMTRLLAMGGFEEQADFVASSVFRASETDHRAIAQ